MLIAKPRKPIIKKPRAEIFETCINSVFVGFLATFITLTHWPINDLVLNRSDMLKTRKLDVF